jgi:hypothetical protein
MSEEKRNGFQERGLYKAFGLTISSCLHFPELLPGVGTPDVTIRYGEVPQELPGATKTEWDFQAIPGQVLLDLEGVRLLVRNGREIIFDRPPEATDDDVRLFILAQAFSALLHQRGILALHGSTIQVNDGCVVFLGRHGMGKSTLATELVRRGYTSLGDDICPITVGEDGVPYAWPAFPHARLWRDSLEQFGIDPEGLRRTRPSREKWYLPLERFCDQERVPLRCIYVLSHPTQDSELTVRAMTGLPRIRVLRDNTYRAPILHGLNQSPVHFEQIVYLASRVPLKRIFRQRGRIEVQKFADLVEEELLACVR